MKNLMFILMLVFTSSFSFANDEKITAEEHASIFYDKLSESAKEQIISKMASGMIDSGVLTLMKESQGISWSDEEEEKLLALIEQKKQLILKEHLPHN